MAWFFAALVNVGVYVGTAILSALLNRNARQESAPGEPQFPTADPTAPIPVVFGTTRVGMNVIHKAHVTRGENTVRNGALSFGWSQTHLGYFYYADIAAVICHGPVAALHDVIVDKTKFLSRTPIAQAAAVDSNGLPYYGAVAIATGTGSLGGLPAFPGFFLGNGGAGPVTITAGDILGGKFDRGGIGAGSADAASAGQMRIYPGNGWNEPNVRLETLVGRALPTYPDLCWVAFESDFYFGNSEQLPSIEFVVTRPVSGPGMGTGLIGNNTANAGTDANPAGILWEILTNSTWGLGLPAMDIDQSSIFALSRAIDRGLDISAEFDVGLSFVLTSQVAGKQVLNDLLRTLDGVLYTDPTSGLLCVRLLRAPDASHYGYNIFNAFILDRTVIRSVEWTESAPDATANEVKVEFVDRARGFTKNSVTVRDVAAIQALGRVESRTVSFVGVQDRDLAIRLAERELRSLSTSLGHAVIECDRTGFLLTPGQFFELYWDVAGKSYRIMRCVSMRDTLHGGVRIEAVEDVYSSPPSAFEVEDAAEPTPIDNVAFVVPYVEPSAQFNALRGSTFEWLKVFDPQGRVTAVEFNETGTWHPAVNPVPPAYTGPPTPYLNEVGQTRAVTRRPLWRVRYTAADGSTQDIIGDFPDVPAVDVIEAPRLSWTLSGGMITVTAKWADGFSPELYMEHSSSGFQVLNRFVSTSLGQTPPLSITFPAPAAGTVEYVSAVRTYDPTTSGRTDTSEYSYLTIPGGDAATATQAYVDAKVAGLSWKQAVRAATTAAGTLASSFENGDTIDGVVLATGDRILIKNQAAGAENGIYVVNASGAPTRATDADAGAELVNATCYVSEGTANADTQWTCSTNAPITVGSTALVFAQLSSGGSPTGAAGGSLAGTYPNPTIASSVSLPGSPTTTTQAVGDNSTKVATTAFVQANAGSAPWRYSVTALSIGNNTTRDMINVSTGRSVLIVSINAGRLAFDGAAEFIVPVEAYGGTPVWAIARSARTSTNGGGIGLEVRLNNGSVDLRVRNTTGATIDTCVMTVTSETENSPTFTNLSASANVAIATTALYGPERLLLSALEQAGATDKQYMTWDNTNKKWVPSSSGPASGVTPATYGDSSNVAQLTLSADGRVTAASNIAISGLGGGAAAEVLISETLLSSTATNVSFTSISALFRGLRVVVSGRGDKASSASCEVRMRFNNDTAANYDYQVTLLNGNNDADPEGRGTTYILCGYLTSVNAPANAPANVDLRIFDYRGTTFHKTVNGQNYLPALVSVSGFLYNDLVGGDWRSTSAINRIDVFPDSGNFIAGTVVSLYGTY